MENIFVKLRSPLGIVVKECYILLNSNELENQPNKKSTTVQVMKNNFGLGKKLC